MYFVQKILRAYPDLYFAQKNDHIIIMLGCCPATLYIGTQNVTFLGLHLGWRPLDPTLDIWSNFVKKEEKKAFYLLF